MAYPERLAKMKLPTLEFRRERADVIQMFKIIKGIDSVQTNRECKVCGNAMLEPSLSTTTRGHDLKLQIQRQTGIRKSFFSARVAQAWNGLSQGTVDAPSVNVFKNRLAREWRGRNNLYNYSFSY